MKVFLHQFALSEELTANLKITEKVFEKQQGADLIIAPEVFTSGFSFSRIDEITAFNNEVVVHLQSLCRLYKTAFTGSLFIRNRNNKTYNRMLFIDKQGFIVTHHDKNKLLAVFDEPNYLKAGKPSKPFFFETFKVALSVCYDLRFPELYRRYALQQTDLMLISAQWPYSRIEHFRQLVIARAIENQCYVIAVNSAPGGYDNVMGGHSMAVSPAGKILLDLGSKMKGKDIDIFVGEVKAARKAFGSLQDFIDGRSWFKKISRRL